MAQILTMTREAVAAYRDLLNALMDLVGGFRPRRRGRPKGDAPVPLRVRHMPPELHHPTSGFQRKPEVFCCLFIVVPTQRGLSFCRVMYEEI